MVLLPPIIWLFLTLGPFATYGANYQLWLGMGWQLDDHVKGQICWVFSQKRITFREITNWPSCGPNSPESLKTLRLGGSAWKLEMICLWYKKTQHRRTYMRNLLCLQTLQCSVFSIDHNYRWLDRLCVLVLNFIDYFSQHHQSREVGNSRDVEIVGRNTTDRSCHYDLLEFIRLTECQN